MQKELLRGLPIVQDIETQDFLRRSLEQSVRGSVKRNRDLEHKIEQQRTEIPLVFSVLEATGLTGLPTPPGALYFVQNDADLLYYDQVSLAFTTLLGGSGIIADAVTNAKLANMSAATVKGQIVGGSGDPVDLTAAQVAAILSSVLVVADITNFAEGVQDVVGAFFIDSADFDVTYDDALNTITGIVKNDAITNAKAANMAQATVKGRAAVAGTGDPVDLTATQLNAIVGSTPLGINLTISPTEQLHVSGKIKAATSTSTHGYIAMNEGSSAQQGFLEWYKPGPTRVGYMGYDDGVTANNVSVTLENSANFIVVNGNLGVGTRSPQGRIHTHDGNGGKLFGSKAISSGTAVNIIPDGTGDVTKMLVLNYVIAGSGGVTQGAHSSIANGSSITIYTNSGNTVSMTVNANGSVEVQRTAGSLTYTVFYDMTWI